MPEQHSRVTREGHLDLQAERRLLEPLVFGDLSQALRGHRARHCFDPSEHRCHCARDQAPCISILDLRKGEPSVNAQPFAMVVMIRG